MDNSFLLAIALFLLTLLAGFWLLRTGKPYRSGIFNLHKLLALAGVVLGIYYLVTQGLMTAAFIAIIILVVLVLFASGAILSIGKPDHPAVLISHRIAAILATILIAFLIFTFV